MHSHILFGVDDGPDNLEEALSILEAAEMEGITDIICTPHAYHPMYHADSSIVREQLTILSDETYKRGINVNLHEGQEIRVTGESLNEIEKKKTVNLANSKYVLLEMPSQTIPRFVSEAISIIINQGLIPIIAHPERNRAIAENPNLLMNLITQGAVAQVTAGSLSGHFGKSLQQLSLQLVQSNLIHLYGSDVHNLHNRPFEYNRGLDVLEKKGLHELVEVLLENNHRVIADESLILLEPEEIRRKKWWSVLSMSH